MGKLDISKTKIGLGLIWSDQFGHFIKLPVQETNPLLKIQSMPKLKYFNCRVDTRRYPSYEEIENLRKLMPQIRINQGGVLGKYIANPNPTWKPEDELWDIEVKTKKLFRVWTWGK